VVDLGAVGGIVAGYVGILLWRRQKRADAAHPAFQGVDDDELRMIRLIHDHGPLHDLNDYRNPQDRFGGAFGCSHGHLLIFRSLDQGRAGNAMRALIRKGLAQQLGNPYTLTDDGRAVYRDRASIVLSGTDFAT
jgi:hypothetical protein